MRPRHLPNAVRLSAVVNSCKCPRRQSIDNGVVTRCQSQSHHAPYQRCSRIQAAFLSAAHASTCTRTTLAAFPIASFSRSMSRRLTALMSACLQTLPRFCRLIGSRNYCATIRSALQTRLKLIGILLERRCISPTSQRRRRRAASIAAITTTTCLQRARRHAMPANLRRGRRLVKYAVEAAASTLIYNARGALRINYERANHLAQE